MKMLNMIWMKRYVDCFVVFGVYKIEKSLLVSMWRCHIEEHNIIDLVRKVGQVWLAEDKHC